MEQRSGTHTTGQLPAVSAQHPAHVASCQQARRTTCGHGVHGIAGVLPRHHQLRAPGADGIVVSVQHSAALRIHCGICTGLIAQTPMAGSGSPWTEPEPAFTTRTADLHAGNAGPCHHRHVAATQVAKAKVRRLGVVDQWQRRVRVGCRACAACRHRRQERCLLPILGIEHRCGLGSVLRGQPLQNGHRACVRWLRIRCLHCSQGCRSRFKRPPAQTAER